jgi:hypothetical protein
MILKHSLVSSHDHSPRDPDEIIYDHAGGRGSHGFRDSRHNQRREHEQGAALCSASLVLERLSSR